MPVQSFEVDIPEATLVDLRQRLADARLDPHDHAIDWDAGTSPAYLHDLVEYWLSAFDWRAQEAQLNRCAHYLATIDDTAVHFIHERGVGDAPLPIVLTHGYPDSFVRFLKIIPLLTDPAAHGGDARDAFDVVVPSLPGFGFSDRPAKAGATFQIGDLWHKLMTDELGYARFGAHGGDWGSVVTEQLARSHADSVVGIHLTDVPFWHGFQKPKDLTPAEEQLFQRNQEFQMQEGAYNMIQGTRPQSIAIGLNDSPAGLAAWLIEKFQRLSDCDGDIENRFTKDELLTNVMVYWVTGTIGTSFLPYYDLMHAGAMRWIMEKAKEWVAASKVPAAFARFPKEFTPQPREWAERFFDVQRWTEMPRGGHFTAMEEPELLAEDIRAFFRPLRRDGVEVSEGRLRA
jgi:pimeloyl-ACP methyl ester carboxylesterase